MLMNKIPELFKFYKETKIVAQIWIRIIQVLYNRHIQLLGTLRLQGIYAD